MTPFSLKELDIVKDFSLPNWEILCLLFNHNKSLFSDNISFTSTTLEWVVEETTLLTKFSLTRHKIDGRRFTNSDDTGLLGISCLNLSDPSVILTEGISDFFSTKLLFPDRNVLGLTTLSTTFFGKMFLINVFKDFLIISDNDFSKKHNTGINNALNLSKFLNQFGRAKIYIPPLPNKDITDYFISELKLNSYL